jgi:NADH:ubiquinone oxidoreductase subunit F (NADH-binding)/NADH:ubiquinone oxidoreductase subunit E
MISSEVKTEIDGIAGAYPRRESALLPALDAAQRANNNLLAAKDIQAVAEQIGVTKAWAYGVATYYTMLNKTPVGKWHLQIDTCVPAMLMGVDAVIAACEKKLGITMGQTTPDGLFTLSAVEDLGSCATCPVIQVNDTYYDSLTPESAVTLIDSLKAGVMPPVKDSCNWSSACDVLLHNRGTRDAATIKGYLKRGGYEGLKKALALTPAQSLDCAKRAIVRGRGGAGFPAGMKWGFIPVNNQKPVYLICNADEGEPGTFKDRQIMEFDPHLLIEGIAIAAHTVQAKKAFIYLRGEYRFISSILEKAIAESAEAGFLNHVTIVVHRGAGSYVCGDETALIESLEGKRGNPRRKPPYFPAAIGLYGCPTIVNNVETLACFPFAFAKGPDEFKKMGVTGNAGPKLFGVSGHVNKPGMYEFELGVPLSRIIEAAGGVKGTLKGVIVGGLSVPILTPEEAAGLAMDYDSCHKRGTMLGSGGIIVINDTVSIPRLALRTIRFYMHESCGQCTPCRDGSVAIERLLAKVLHRQGSVADIDRVLALCTSIKGLTLCPTGDAFAMPVEAMVSKYRSEFEALTK